MQYTFYIDQKVTVWERMDCTIEANSYEEALEKANKVFEDSYYAEEDPNISEETETLYDSMENLSRKDNGDQPTRELIYVEYREEKTLKTN